MEGAFLANWQISRFRVVGPLYRFPRENGAVLAVIHVQLRALLIGWWDWSKESEKRREVVVK